MNITKGLMKGFHRGDSDFVRYSEIVKQVLGGVIKENTVLLSATHSGAVKLQPIEDTLQIHIWAYLEGHKIVQPAPTSLFGVTDFCKDALYAPSGAGNQVVSPEGAVVAEYFPDEKILIILLDAVHNENGGSEQLFTAIINEFPLAYATDGKKYTKEELEALRAKARIEQRNKRITERLTDMVNRKLQEAERKVRDYTVSVENYKASLTNTIRQLTTAMKEVEMFRSDSSEVGAKLRAEFEKLTTVNKIIDFDFDGRWLILYTDTLYADVMGKLFLIGKFMVKINTSDSKVVFENLTPENRRKGFWGDRGHAPHVSPSGDACLGNISNTIVELVTQNEWSALADIMVGYLESVNTDDPAGKYYVNWDRVDPKTLQKIPNDAKVYGGSDDDMVTCERCDASVHEDDSYTCHHCDATLCEDCYTTVQSGDYVCDSCLAAYYTKCERCGEYIHNDRIRTCEQCGDKICGSCADMYDGKYFCGESDCHDIYVDERTPSGAGVEANVVLFDEAPAPFEAPVAATLEVEKCPVCGVTYTHDALYTCEICGKQGCPDCIQVNGSGQYTCKEHR